MSDSSIRTDIPFVDRSLRECLQTLGMTALICLFIAAVTQWMNDGGYIDNLRIALGFGFSIVLSLYVLHLVAPGRWLPAKNALAFLIGMAIGLSNLSSVAYNSPTAVWVFTDNTANLRNIVFSTAISLTVFFFFYTQYRAQKYRLQAKQSALESAELNRSRAISELQLLQSQIEPHFLFNTLAHVEALTESDPQQARVLLRDLTSMLRTSLTRTRSAMTTLGEELEFLRHYLQILQHRIGDRLHFTIDCADSLRTVPLPPLLVQPLVENAIQHGLEPSVEGGELVISARSDADNLVIRVSDTGVGPGPEASKQSIGLKNVRSRLRLIYGDEARCELQPNQPSGLTAQLLIPLNATNNLKPELDDAYDTHCTDR